MSKDHDRSERTAASYRASGHRYSLKLMIDQGDHWRVIDTGIMGEEGHEPGTEHDGFYVMVRGDSVTDIAERIYRAITGTPRSEEPS